MESSDAVPVAPLDPDAGPGGLTAVATAGGSDASHPPPARRPDARAPVSGRLVRAGVWLVILGVGAYAVGVLTTSGTALGDIGRYALYWALCVLVPGTIVVKAVRGTAGSWLADVSLGAAAGLSAELVAWALASALDARGLLRLWPLLTLVLFAHRGTRARILSRPHQPSSPLMLLVVAASCAQVVWLVSRSYLQTVPLPPTGRTYYPDLMWHLGLVNEATRAFPLGTPQATEAGLLVYHWFSDAHIATASMITGVDTTTVLLRLWILPITVLTVVLTAVLTRRVSGSDWAAAGAAALVSTTVTVPFWPQLWASSNHLNPLSPSQQYSTPLTLFLVYAIVDLLRSSPGSRRASALLVAIAAVAVSGSKSSALPIVLGGVAAAAVAAVVLRRQRRTTLVLLGSLAVLTALAQHFVAGGSFGAGVQLLSSLSLTRPYRMLLGTHIDFHTPVIAGLVDTPELGPTLLVALLCIGVLIVLRLLPALLPLFQRTLRRDLSAWVLSGLCLAALVPFVALGHVGYSEYYFVFGAIPFGCVLALWSLSALVRDHPGSRRVTLAVAGTSAVLTAVVGWYRLGSPAVSTLDDMVREVRSFVLQFAVATVVLAAAVVVVLVRRRRGDGRWVPAPLAALVAMGIIAGPLYVVSTATSVQPRPTEGATPLAQSTAALWIKAHVPLDALLATNAHCRGAVQQPCDSRTWWISGLAGRRVLVEGWSYLPDGRDGYPDQALLRLNQAAFERPSAADVQALADRGVTWLVAQSVPGSSPSKALGTYAHERYRLGNIVVYEMPVRGTTAP